MLEGCRMHRARRSRFGTIRRSALFPFGSTRLSFLALAWAEQAEMISEFSEAYWTPETLEILESVSELTGQQRVSSRRSHRSLNERHRLPSDQQLLDSACVTFRYLARRKAGPFIKTPVRPSHRSLNERHRLPSDQQLLDSACVTFRYLARRSPRST